MAISLAFWLALLLPGYVAVRAVAPDELKSGLLGTVGVSYLAVFCLLAPFSIACYLLRLPVAILSVITLAVIVGAAIHISHKRWWRDLGALIVAGVCFELMILVIDLALGAQVGGYLFGGDGRTHVARIRFLLDHGFSNADPFYATEYFFPIYHTNLLHALNAVCAQVTHVDVLGVWFMSLVFGKLLIAAGCYYLGWRLFEHAWVAWTAALAAIGMLGPTTYLVYPNVLAPFWLLPMMVGFAVQACQPSAGRAVILKLAAGSFVLGQVHGMYAVFAGMGLAPVFAAVLAYRVLRRRPGAGLMTGCIAALFAGAPFVVAAQAGRAMDPDKRGALPEQTPRFIHLENGWALRDPRSMMGTEGVLGLTLVAAGVGWAVIGPRRRETGVLVGVTAVGAALLFIPPVCSLAIRVFRAEWIVARLAILLNLGMIGLGVSGAAALLIPRLRRRWLRVPLSIGVVLLGALFANRLEPHNWRYYLREAVSPSDYTRGWLKHLREYRAFCRENIPAGSTVLGDGQTQLWLCMLHDAYGTAVDRGGGIPGLAQRGYETVLMLQPYTPWSQRRQLLRKYGITQFLRPADDSPHPGSMDWVYEHRAVPDKQFADNILSTLDTS